MKPPETADSRQAIFNFADGTQLVVEWPFSRPDEAPRLESRVQRALSSSQFTVEAGGNLVVIQMANVNYVEIIPAPAELPPEVIRNGSVQRSE